MNQNEDSNATTIRAPPSNLDKTFEKWLTVDNIEKFQESCPVQIVTHSVMGFGFGCLLGLFLSSVGPSSFELSQANANGSSILNKETVKSIFKEMGSKTWSSGKNLGMVAGIFTAFECTLETYRAKHDMINTALAGCLSGGVLGAKAGPKASLLGCAGFAAFSCAIETFLQR